MIKLNSALKRLRAEYKLNQHEFGKIVGLTNTTISAYENGTREPNQDTLIKLADHFNVSLDYVTGRSDSKGPYAKITGDEIIPIVNPGFYKIPILGTVHAGSPIFAEENYEGFIYSNYMPDEHFAVRVRGDCLIDLGIMENTILTIRKQKHISTNEIVVGLLYDEIIIRQYIHHSEHVHYLITRNSRKAYPPIVWNATTDFMIIGRTVEIMTKAV